MGIPKSNMQKETEVLYMSFDRFLLAVESHVLSQADEFYKSVFFNFTKFQFLHNEIYNYTKKSRDSKRSSATHHSALELRHSYNTLVCLR